MSAVQVAVRIRPLSTKELVDSAINTVSTTGNAKNTLNITHYPDIDDSSEKGSCPMSLTSVQPSTKSFNFDYIFDENSSRDDVYMNSVNPLTNNFLDGFNATILAYGQTGSGKTYTMGTEIQADNKHSDNGIVRRAVDDIFGTMNYRCNDFEKYDKYEYKVSVSFIELYNEEIIDLLESSLSINSMISIRETSGGKIMLSGVSEFPVFSKEELIYELERGLLLRSTGSTDMNLTSSRSHAIFTIILQQEFIIKGAAEGGTTCLESRFNFVDLAGSERLKKTNSDGDRRKEGISINQGLLALGNVISSLSDRKKGSHIPYRDSKLTRLLQESLGGNSQTLMIACISPSNFNYSESVNTLKYASRARSIRNVAIMNKVCKLNVDELLRENNLLKMEIAKLKSLDNANTPAKLKTISGLNKEEYFQQSFEDYDSQSLRYEVELSRYAIIRLKKLVRNLQKENVNAKIQRDIISVKYAQRFIEDKENDTMDTDLGEENYLMREIKNLIKSYSRTISNTNFKLDNANEKIEWLEDIISSFTNSEINTHVEEDLFTSELIDIPQIIDDFSTSNNLKLKQIAEIIREYNFENDDNDEICRMTDHLERLSIHAEISGLQNDITHDDGTSLVETSPETRTDKVSNLYSTISKIQSSIAEHENLIDRINNADNEMHSMQQEFEDKMKGLQSQLIGAIRERDDALSKALNKGSNEKSNDVNSIKKQYELKAQKLEKHIAEMRNSFQNNIKKHEDTKSKNLDAARLLQQKVQEMKSERVKVMKDLRNEISKNRELQSSSNKEIAKLKRKELAANDEVRKLERSTLLQKQLLKRKAEEITASSRKLRAVMTLMKKRGKCEVVQKKVKVPADEATKRPSDIDIITEIRNTKINSLPFDLKIGYKMKILRREIDSCVSFRYTLEELKNTSEKLHSLRLERGEICNFLSSGEGNSSIVKQSNIENIDGEIALLEMREKRIRTMIYNLYGNVLNNSEEMTTSRYAKIDDNGNLITQPDKSFVDISYENAIALIHDLDPFELESIGAKMVENLIDIQLSRSKDANKIQEYELELDLLKSILTDNKFFELNSSSGWSSSKFKNVLQDQSSNVFERLANTHTLASQAKLRGAMYP